MPINTPAEKVQQTTDEIGRDPDVQSIPFIYIEGFPLKLRAVSITSSNNSSSNSFLFGHPVNGILGTANGLGGGQIVFGETTGAVRIELVKRSYEWRTREDFKRGSITNLDISQGYLQLGNVTVKDILLEHKEK